MKIPLTQVRTEILSGLTVSISLVPEAISFALLVGAAPNIGLWAAFFMVMSSAIFGGRPGIISGATGATAVIMAGLVETQGIDQLFLGVIVAGVIQLIIWSTSLWKVFSRIPSTVISGFLISLAVLIFISQLKYLSIGDPSISQVILMILVIIVCILVMKWSGSKFNFPSALSAIAIGCILGIPFEFSTVGDLSKVTSSFPAFSIPYIDINTILTVLPYSFGMAISGLTESLLTVDSVSKKLSDNGDKRKETFAQGLGNIVSGFFGTMGGCVLVGQTNLNINSGAKNRLSAITAGIGLMSIIIFFGKWIEKIPLVGLIGVMLVVVYETGDWKSLTSKNKKSLSIIGITIIASLLTHNLAIGVITGCISSLIISYKK